MKIIALLFMAASLHAVTLEWDANTETNLAGYRVYWGKASRSYTHTLTVTNTMAVITNLFMGTNYFAVTAFDTDGLESDYSDEVFTVQPPTLRNLRVVPK